MRAHHRDLRAAEACIKHGVPVPLDIAMRLLAAGIDIDTIERKERP